MRHSSTSKTPTTRCTSGARSYSRARRRPTVTWCARWRASCRWCRATARKCVRSPFQLGRPVWIDDPHFTILYHIRRTGVPAPGGDDELRNLAGRVLAQHLDRARPLWELWMVEGLKGDRWALIAKTHHAMVDGVSGTDLLAVLLDVSPDGAAPVDMEWRAQPEPNALQLLADTAVSSVMDPMTHVRGLPAVAR